MLLSQFVPSSPSSSVSTSLLSMSASLFLSHKSLPAPPGKAKEFSTANGPKSKI